MMKSKSQTHHGYKSILSAVNNDDACYPWCDECATGGACHSCQACVGQSGNKDCDSCFKVDSSNP